MAYILRQLKHHFRFLRGSAEYSKTVVPSYPGHFMAWNLNGDGMTGLTIQIRHPDGLHIPIVCAQNLASSH